MAAAPPIAYPFVEVFITPPPTPTARRAPGVLAVVGKTTAGGTAADVPVEIVTLDDAVANFASKNPDGTVVSTPLYRSLALAFLQDPRPSKVYGVRVDGDDYAAALASLEGVDDVTFVSLAEEVAVGTASGADPATGLMALKEHVESMSAQGRQRVGVAMIDPDAPKSLTYVKDATAMVEGLKSTVSRMIMVAARGASGDVATAAAATIAGLPPQASVVLKKINGISIPPEKRYSPSEIIGLSNDNVIPIIRPALIVGESLNFAEGRLFTTDASLLYIDLVRVIDDVNYRLQAGLIGLVGNARITKPGLLLLKTKISTILNPLVDSSELDGYSIDIPILSLLLIPPTARTATEAAQIADARLSRVVDAYVTIVYGPAVHRLRVNLAVTY